MKLLLAVTLLSLCLITQVLRAQEAPPDLPLRGPEFDNPADAYANDVMTRADQMMQTKDYSGASMLLMENFDRLTRLRASFFGKMLSLRLAQENSKARNEAALAARRMLRLNNKITEIPARFEQIAARRKK